VSVSVVKGTRVLVSRLVVPSLHFSLAGAQMKFSARKEEFEGIVTHIRGDHPTEPKKIEFSDLIEVHRDLAIRLGQEIVRHPTTVYLRTGVRTLACVLRVHVRHDKLHMVALCTVRKDDGTEETVPSSQIAAVITPEGS
jgi:hypothetical protein